MRSRTAAGLLVVSFVAACAGDDDGGIDCPSGGEPIPVDLEVQVASQFLGVAPEQSAWVAFQDGACAWQRVTGEDGHYQAEVSRGRYQVAVGCPIQDDLTPVLALRYALPDDPLAPVVCPERLADDASAGDVGMQLTDPGGDAQFRFSAGGFTDIWNEVGDVVVETSVGALAGTFDIVVTSDELTDGPQFQLLFDRQVDVPPGALVEIDGTTTGWVALEEASASINHTAGELTALDGSLLTSAGTFVPLDSGAWLDEPSGEISQPMPRVPASSQAAADLYALQASWEALSVDDASRTRAILASALDSPALTPPPLVEDAAIEYAAADDPRYRATLQLVDDAIAYVITSDGASRLDLLATAGWLDDPASPSIELPDLRGVDGWQSGFSWTTAQDWTVGAIGDSGGLAAEALVARIGQSSSSTDGLDGVDRWTSQVSVSPQAAR